VLVRDLDERVVDSLKARAKENGRSLQSELKLVLERAARVEPVRLPREIYRVLADRLRAAIGDRPQSDSTELLVEDRNSDP
jgi:antitoxin FitA